MQLTTDSSSQGIVPSSKIPFPTAHKYILTSRGRDYAVVVVMSRAHSIQNTPLLHFGDELNGFIVLPQGSLRDMQSVEVVVSPFPNGVVPN